MKKTLTINVPDELWVNSFEQNLTKTFEYDGPETIWFVSRGEFINPSFTTEEPETTDLTETVHVINIEDATDEELALAILLVHGAEEYEFTYVDEINHDGSIYKRIDNPRLEEYFSAKMLGGNIKLEPIVKDPLNPNEAIAKERKAYVLKYANAFEFDDSQDELINNYLNRIEEYLDIMKTAYPWKFIEMNKNEIPKIPVSLITLFNSLPELP